MGRKWEFLSKPSYLATLLPGNNLLFIEVVRPTEHKQVRLYDNLKKNLVNYSSLIGKCMVKYL